MPLHLSQHKSYHPYKRVNREKVRIDELQAADRQHRDRQASLAHRDHARLEALRSRRIHSSASVEAAQDFQPADSPSQIQSSRSHSKPRSGHALLRPEDELTPWYTTSQLRNGAEAGKTEDQRLKDTYKDLSSKSSNDPLKAMQAFLAQRKAAKQLPSSSPSSSHFDSHAASDLYEPDAVRAAQSRRRHHHHHSSSKLGSFGQGASHTHCRHRPANAPGRHASRSEADNKRHYQQIHHQQP